MNVSPGPSRLTLGQTTRKSHRVGGWVLLRSGVDIVGGMINNEYWNRTIIFCTRAESVMQSINIFHIYIF